MTALRAVVLGGGMGGVVVSRRLKDLLGSRINVTLVDKSPAHVFQPAYLGILSGTRTLEGISRDLSRLQKKGIEFVNAEVKEIAVDKRVVSVDSREIGYDYLVVALGAELDMSSIPGPTEAGFNLYSPQGIADIRAAVDRIDSGEIVILIPAMPYKCPAAPYETAFLLDSRLRDRGVRDRVRISIKSCEPAPMPAAGPDAGQAVKQLLEMRGISFTPMLTVQSVGAEKKVTFSDGSDIQADILIVVPPHRTPAVVSQAGLTGESGWVNVDRHTLMTSHPSVFAIGDISAVSLEGRYNPEKPLMLPKAGVFAHREAEIVAKNIAADIKGGAPALFDGHGSCFLDLGDGTAAYAAGNFYGIPRPEITLRKPARRWHWLKLWVEKYWFWRWF